MRISVDAPGNHVSRKFVRPVSSSQLISPVSVEPKPLTWGDRLQRWLHAFAGSSEPRITRARDHYRVYDPTTGNSATFASDTEVRIWLEKRYSR
jgi:hypothetical protein